MHRTVVAAFILTLVPGLASAAEGQAAAGAESGQPEERSGPRLRFRSGPVCMCNQGLSEEDIRRSQQRWEFTPEASPRRGEPDRDTTREEK